MSYERERDVALQAVRKAAVLCQSVQAQIDPSVLEKDDRSPVTVADFGSQALICNALREAFPEDPIIAEEDSTALKANQGILLQVTQQVQQIRSGVTPNTACSWIDYGNAGEYSDRFWTLDPIDGTKGFVRGDQYAIALALIVDGVPQVAALACPNLPADLDDADAETGQAFIAVHGEGAYQVPLATDADANGTPIHVADTDNPADGRFTDSFVSAHSSHDTAQDTADTLGLTAEPIRMDSQAKYAIVGRGDADIYFRLPRPGSDYTEKIWDHAAGMLVVEAAGGTVTDVNGKALDFTHAPFLSENTGIVATSGSFHQDVLDALAKHMA
jgi:3'(2'), 5'-bisphosphate nucleotidase